MNLIVQTTNQINNHINFKYSFKPAKFIFILLLPTFFFINANAQENILKDIVPPPLEKISKGETDQLNSEADSKKRVELALELMETRLKKAETFSNEKKFKESLDELGGFSALMRDTMKNLERNNTGNRKIIGSFKRFEINLRSFVPRLELVRRILPDKFAYHVVQLMKFVRNTRAKAVEPLFSDKVVSDN